MWRQLDTKVIANMGFLSIGMVIEAVPDDHSSYRNFVLYPKKQFPEFVPCTDLLLVPRMHHLPPPAAQLVVLLIAS